MFSSRDSIIKSQSAKPLKYTLRDSAFITFITVIVMVLATLAYGRFTGKTYSAAELADKAMMTAFTSMITQFVYEYSGLNIKIAESTLRYNPQ